MILEKSDSVLIFTVACNLDNQIYSPMIIRDDENIVVEREVNQSHQSSTIIMAAASGYAVRCCGRRWLLATCRDTTDRLKKRACLAASLETKEDDGLTHSLNE
jgi:hypothetical protein